MPKQESNEVQIIETLEEFIKNYFTGKPIGVQKREAAILFSVTTQTVYNWIKDGDILIFHYRDRYVAIREIAKSPVSL
jgi:hypothetical protein